MVVNKAVLMFNSMVLSGLVTVFILIITALLLSRRTGMSILDLAKDEGWPSLARTQFLLWTILIIFCFTTISLIKIFRGVLDVPADIPENLLALMGISVGATSTSAYLSGSKYAHKELTEKEKSELKKKQIWASLILENDRPSLTRFQMLSWTVIGIIIYIGLFKGTLANLNVNDTEMLQNLTLPEIDISLVVLMGLSQGSYVAGKWIAPTSIEVFNVYPKKGKVNETATIRGHNFGDVKDTIMVDKVLIKGDDIVFWENNRIDFKLPSEGMTNIKVKVLVGAREAKTKKDVDIEEIMKVP